MYFIMSGKFLVILVVVAFIGATQAGTAKLVVAMLEYREKCLAVSGSEEGYQQVLNPINPVTICILNQLDVLQLQMDAMKLARGSRKYATQAGTAELVAAMLEYREKCIAVSGSEEGYQQVLNSIDPAQICILNQLDVLQLQMDAMLLARGSRKYFFDKYCPKLNESLSCFDDTLEGVAKCVGNNDDKVKEIMKSVAHNLLDLACQNDGQLIFDVQKPEFKECITQLTEHKECEFSDATKEMSIARYGEEQCRELDDTLECLKRKVDECDAPTLFDVFQVVLNEISKANDCKQYTTLGELQGNNIDGTVSGD